MGYSDLVDGLIFFFGLRRGCAISHLLLCCCLGGLVWLLGGFGRLVCGVWVCCWFQVLWGCVVGGGGCEGF